MVLTVTVRVVERASSMFNFRASYNIQEIFKVDYFLWRSFYILLVFQCANLLKLDVLFKRETFFSWSFLDHEQRSP